jgi:hypothetical protein
MPDRNYYLGSDYGDLITAEEALRIVVEWGLDPAVLDDPAVYE